MPFSIEDKQAIKMLRQTKRYGAKCLMSMFPNKQWSLGGLKKLIRKIDDTGKVDRRSAPDSSRPRTARLADKIDEVDDLILSQDNAPKTHRSRRQIARQTGISLTTVNRIIKNDLRLKCLKKRRAHELTEANKIVRRNRCRQLLKRYLASMVNFRWFTDEKIFTVAAPSNSQNDRLYAPVAVRKKDVDELRERIVEEWDKLDQRIIDNAVGQWRKRLRACVAADGGQFEHKM